MSIKEGKAEIGLGIFFTVMGIVFLAIIIPTQIKYVEGAYPQPRFFPDLISALTIVMGLCVPAETPDEIVEILRDAFAKASEDETYKEILENCNLTWAYMTGEEYEAMVREMYDEFGSRLSEAAE